MAKSDEKKATSGAPQAVAPTQATGQAAPESQQPPPVQIDDSEIRGGYANFCRVTGSPEELIIDFGLNSQPSGAPVDAIKVTQRLIVNFYTAKRLLGALSMAIQRHEAAFGVLETDIRKRLKVPPTAGN